MKCGKTEISRHANTEKHIKNVKKIQQTPKIQNFLKTTESPLNVKIKSAEIALAAFFAEHNVALTTVEHFVPLLQQVVPDSKILAGITLGTTKCTEIIRNVLEPCETEELVEILKKSKFSILLDESTDISSKKLFCVLVSNENCNSITFLLIKNK